jgi:nicotinamide-nucleotide amidase
MVAEIISIGDELTSGERLDTNSQWLSQRLGEVGIRVAYHTTVADDLEANVRVLRESFARADVIICTGGLGPTADDLTRQALAATLGVELELDAASLAHIEQLFARRQRPMPPANQIQAMFPVGSRVIPNPHGTAPGIDYQVTRPGRTSARIFCLPGVPAEMKEMWAATVLPRLTDAHLAAQQLIRHKCLKCFGVGESDLEAMLPDLIRRGREPQVGITVSQATITLRITACAAIAADCEAQMAPTLATIRECLGNLVYGEDDEELQHVVGRQLQQCGQTLSTLELATPGLLSRWLAALPAAGSPYRGGLVVPADARSWPSPLVGLAAAPSTGWTAEYATTVARRVREQWGTDYGLVIGPRPAAEPPSSSPPAEVGRVWLALVGPTADEVEVVAWPFSGHPDVVEARAAKTALNLLRLKIL